MKKIKERKFEEKEFEVKGMISFNKGEKKFSKKIHAFNEGHARELAYSLFGSKNGLKRRSIKIIEVEEVRG
ncbi:MAG: 50S ribosomal protein L18Ae [Candidatus Diapherotrites archaeon]